MATHIIIGHAILEKSSCLETESRLILIIIYCQVDEPGKRTNNFRGYVWWRGGGGGGVANITGLIKLTTVYICWGSVWRASKQVHGNIK